MPPVGGDAFDGQRVARERGDRRLEERRVHVAAVVHIAVGTYPVHIGRERGGQRRPVVGGERSEVALHHVAPERLVEHSPAAGRQRHLGDQRDAGGAHLARRLHDHAVQGVRVEPGRDIDELGLEEHQTQRIFEHLRVGVTAQGVLADQCLHARDRRRVVARLREHGTKLERLLFLKCFAPA